ncbi:MAG: peptidoglycan-binding protein LysM [Chitinophagales bacterium]|nr:peptidoglycan-binding protein LysM [Bacteroidota bacterium]MCB9257096.1 peptidoglycan-binding protein LysM [Chitinophagales bacterium]
MGLLSFVKDAGAKLFGKEEEKTASDKEKNDALINHINRFNLRTEGVNAILRGSTVILEGKVDTLQEKNRIVMAAGNIKGIDAVDDRVLVEEQIEKEPETQFYTVVSGDYLSKIAKKVYGNANKYNIIFEANRPMLEDPDKIYPGQVLVIPSLD